MHKPSGIRGLVPFNVESVGLDGTYPGFDIHLHEVKAGKREVPGEEDADREHHSQWAHERRDQRT